MEFIRNKTYTRSQQKAIFDALIRNEQAVSYYLGLTKEKDILDIYQILCLWNQSPSCQMRSQVSQCHVDMASKNKLLARMLCYYGGTMEDIIHCMLFCYELGVCFEYSSGVKAICPDNLTQSQLKMVEFFRKLISTDANTRDTSGESNRESALDSEPTNEN